MPYRANPFLERMSERTTSDQDFVRLFSPKVLERLPDDVFEGAVHIFRSPPGGGKTTLLRAFTPPALRAFWSVRRSPEMSESHQRLLARGVVDEHTGPALLGVMLSCASGYADLPAGAAFSEDRLFRALLNCRIVLRTLRSLSSLLGVGSEQELDHLRIEYDADVRDLKHIPLLRKAGELLRWAEASERQVYADLDSLSGQSTSRPAGDLRFEGVLWLQGVRFVRAGICTDCKRLLMIDDLHKLRRKQRLLLISELADLRPRIPVWLAERNIALGDELLSQGVREGREVKHYPLEEMWHAGKGQHQFQSFAQNVLDRRLQMQSELPRASFSQFLRSQLTVDEIGASLAQGAASFGMDVDALRASDRYAEWIARAEARVSERDPDALKELYRIRILIARDQAKRQLSLELGPLSLEEIEERDSSNVQAAAELFAHTDLGVPYYYGIERLCTLATSNIEELLALASALFEGLRAKVVLRRAELQLSPSEQERLLAAAARKRFEFIPKNHTEGTRAQRLLDAIGRFCNERTFLPNAPYAPGVTGVRLAQPELRKLNSEQGPLATRLAVLKRVLAECVAENLLVVRPSAASTNRDSGTVFYLSRVLCVHFGLPLQMGGWQDVRAEALVDWMEASRSAGRQRRLGIN